MAVSVTTFSEVRNFADELSIGTRSTSANGAVYFNPKPGHYNLYKGPDDMKQSFYVRPMKLNNMNTSSVKPGTKFEINLQVKDPGFVAACGRLDDYVLDAVFARKAELLPSKAEWIKSKDALVPMYVKGKFLSPGSPAPDGSMYADTIRLKIIGEWAPFVTAVKTRKITMRGEKREMADSCEWAPRNLTTHPMGPADTRFFLWLRTDEKTGGDVYTDKVKTAEGEYRAVGPQDCLPGCTITPIFSMSNIYFNDNIGVTADARALYIRPRVDTRVVPGMFGKAGAAAAVPMLGGAIIEDIDM